MCEIGRNAYHDQTPNIRIRNVDFATILPGLPKAKVKSRIILTPEHAKRLLLSLQENITRYESNIGKIEIPQPSRNNEDPLVGMGPMGNA